MSVPPLEETFAGMLGRMRVVDKGGADGRDASRRFAVMVRPLGVPDDVELVVEICSMQYRPHALAFAALPELIDALTKAGAAVTALIKRDEGRSWPIEVEVAGNATLAAIMKAEPAD